ncbi:MAG: pirin family protein, partial [Clostridia bacterium]|nr:pirin family protein [Deltaproteobacteria bacterium]
VRDLGDGFKVRRALPSAHKRMVGPFIFFDQMGEVVFNSGQGLDVRPHPHIGLSTLSYLLEGEILHRDSVGSVQRIQPGEVNWMTAGAGIVHSERTAPDTRAKGHTLLGVQVWIALPKSHEEIAPSFTHYTADQLPTAEADGARITAIAGTCDGLKSPVATYSDMIYADIVLEPGARYRVIAEHSERAVYVIQGAIDVEGGTFEINELVVLKPGAEVVLTARGPTRLMLVGGEPLSEERHIFWNFVSSSTDRLEQAKSDWREKRFPVVPEEHEFIPLPDDSKAVHYP